MNVFQQVSPKRLYEIVVSLIRLYVRSSHSDRTNDVYCSLHNSLSLSLSGPDISVSSKHFLSAVFSYFNEGQTKTDCLQRYLKVQFVTTLLYLQ